MNLKSNYLFKKMLKWANKQNNFNIYDAPFKKKIKKNTWRYHFTPCTKNLDMISSSWDIKCNRLKLVILGQFLPFTPPPPTRCLKLQKSKFLKNEKNCWWYHHLNMCTKNHNHMMCSFWDTSEADRSFCHIGPFFALLPH